MQAEDFLLAVSLAAMSMVALTGRGEKNEKEAKPKVCEETFVL